MRLVSFALAAVFAACLLGGPAVEAQYPCNTCYQQQTYVQPTYQHQQTYYPAQKVIANDIAVAPLIVTVPVVMPSVPIAHAAVPIEAYGQAFSYSTEAAYSADARTRKIFREELARVLPQIQQSAPAAPMMLPPQAPAVPMTPQLPPAAPSAPLAANPAIPDTTTPADLQVKVLDVFKSKNCLLCHGAAGTAKGSNGAEFRLVMDDGKGGLLLRQQSSDRRWKTFGMCSVGAMPPVAANDATKAVEPDKLQVLLNYALIK